MALTDADLQRISDLLDEKLDQKFNEKLQPINAKLDVLTDAVKLLLYANPQLWQYSPFEKHPGTFTLPQRRAVGA